MENMYTIYDMGDRIRARRNELGLSRQKMSALMRNMGSDVYFKTIENWEFGKNNCSITNIPYLCKVLDCDTEYLFGNSSTPHKETATVMETTGLTQKAVEKLTEFKKTQKSEKYTYSGYLSALIEDKNFSAMAKNMIQAAYFVNGNNTNNDIENQLWPTGRYISGEAENGGLDKLFSILDGNPSRIEDERKYELLLTAMKHDAMDLYGKFFDSQMEETLQQSKRRGEEGKHRIEVVKFGDLNKHREGGNNGEH